APDHPFTLSEARALWARLVAGWADHLDDTGGRTLIDGVPNRHDAGGSYEGVTRMLWGLGGWLSQPGRDPIVHWRGRAYDTVTLTRRAILAGTDPESRGFWGVPPSPGAADQRTVESGQVGFALWQSRAHIWDSLTEPEREQVIAWLEACGQRPPIWRNNWALFWALNHASRKALGARHEQAIIDDVLAWLDAVYCGNGWYDDGPARGADHFDDYNLWVFSSHVLAWAAVDGASAPARRDELLERIRAQMEHVPFFFAADGGYPLQGRSLAYKFARLGAPLWAYGAGVWPHSPGMLKRLVGRHLRWHEARGAIRADGTLRQEVTSEGSLDIRETYIATGSTYWAMQAFGGLWSFPDDDPFWTVDEEPLPIERGDFIRVLPETGWILAGDRASGAVQRFSARSQGSAAKYGKYVYSTARPFNVGLAGDHPSPDSMLCLTCAGEIGHKGVVDASAVGDDGWLRMRYRQTLGGFEHLIETVIVLDGTRHLRAHRIRLAEGAPPVSAIEGGYPLGYSPGAIPIVRASVVPLTSSAEVAGQRVEIVAVEGYSAADRPATWRGDESLNSVSGRYVLPLLHIEQVRPVHDAVCLISIGPAQDGHRDLNGCDWNDDGAVRVTWSDGGSVIVPPLSAAEPV
nr:DUF2264 domain-containing protein [Chloroflexia bacterium]